MPRDCNSTWAGRRDLGSCHSPVLTAWASLRFSASKTDPGQVLWFDQSALFLVGRKTRIQTHTTQEWNHVLKMLWVIPVGGRWPAPGGPCLQLNCSCLCPVLHPPAPPHRSPAGSQEMSTEPGKVAGGMLSHVAQVRPGVSWHPPPQRPGGAGWREPMCLSCDVGPPAGVH